MTHLIGNEGFTSKAGKAVESSKLNGTHSKNKSKTVIREQQEHLVEQAKAGSVPAYTQIVSHYQDYLRAFVASRTSYPQDVDDLAQETFVLAFRKIGELQEAVALKSWLSGIALNLVRNHSRKHKRVVLEEHNKIEALIDSELNETDNDPHLSLNALKSCLLKLKHDRQALVRKHYIDGISLKDLTEELGIKHSTMTMRLHRCRQILKDCIKKQLTGEGHD